MAEQRSFVFECGTVRTLVGYSGDEAPKVMVPSALTTTSMGDDNRGWAHLKIVPSVESFRLGSARNTEVRPVWDSAAERPAVIPEGHAALLQQCLGEMHESTNLMEASALIVMRDFENDPSLREGLAEILFEELGLNSCWFASTSVLSLLAMGKGDGVAVRVGASGTSIAPVVDGYRLHSSTKWQPMGGDLLDAELFRNLQRPGSVLHATEKNGLLYDNEDRRQSGWWAAHGVYRDLKESLMRVQYGGKTKGFVATSRASMFELPDGTLLDMHHPACVKVPELLFQPRQTAEALEGFDDEGDIPKYWVAPPYSAAESIGKLFRSAVLSCDEGARELVLGNVVVTGGTTKLVGFSERFAKGILSDDVLLRICRPRIHQESFFKEKDFGPFVGGAILSSLSSFQRMWVSRSEFSEVGRSLLMRRCLL